MKLNTRTRRWAARLGVVAATLGLAVVAPSSPAQAAFSAKCPVAGSISQEWGGGHDGIDIANSLGTPIYSVGPGTVTFSATADPDGYGQYITIKHNDGSATQYGHMRKRLVSTGQQVVAGQKIAEMGAEGSSTGSHLHLRTYSSAGDGSGVNPRGYLSSRGISLPCSPGSGSSGNFSTWGNDVRVRQSPSTSAGVVTTFNGPTSIHVQCQKHAQSVTAEGYTNDAWAYITSPNTGWLSNIYVDSSAAWLPGVADCGSSNDKTFRTWGTDINIRSSASTSASVVRTLSGPTTIGVKCQKHAESVTAEGYTNDAWAQVSTPVSGWISNIYVDDPAAWLPGVPTC
jgi:hypothetical protein